MCSLPSLVQLAGLLPVALQARRDIDCGQAVAELSRAQASICIRTPHDRCLGLVLAVATVASSKKLINNTSITPAPIVPHNEFIQVKTPPSAVCTFSIAAVC